MNYKSLPKMRGVKGSEGLDILRDFIGGMEIPFDCIQVAGTNGKGSAAVMIADILTASGIKTGLFTSPHIIEWNERICVDGQPIPDEDMERLFLEVREEAKRADLSHIFCQSDYLMCVALKYFKTQGVKAAVLECGLGGEFDGTSVVKRNTAVITRIELDHTRVLGSTIGGIAKSKCGLISSGMMVITGRQHHEAQEVIQSECESRGAKLYFAPVPEEIGIIMGKTQFMIGGQKFCVNLTGDYQAENACVAIKTAEIYLSNSGRGLDERAIKTALMNLYLPGRMQLIGQDPVAIADCSHNPAAVKQCCDTIKALYPGKKTVILCAIMPEKEYSEMMRVMDADCFVCTSLDGTVAPGMLSGASGNKQALCIEDAEEAFDKAKETALSVDGVLLVTGGFAITAFAIKRSGVNLK